MLITIGNSRCYEYCHAMQYCPTLITFSCFPQLLRWLLQCCVQFLEQSQLYLLPFCASCVTGIGNRNIPLYLIQSHHYDTHVQYFCTMYNNLLLLCNIVAHVYVVFSVQYAGTCTGPCQSSLITVGVLTVDASIMIHS